MRNICIALLLIIFAVGALAGCTRDTDSIAAAEQVLFDHFEAIRLGDTNALVAHYSPEFFRQSNREHFLASITGIRTNGSPEFTVVDRDLRRDANGATVSFSCKSQYGTMSFQEDFDFYRAEGSTNFVISRHDFD